MTYEYAKEMFPDFTDGEETFIQFLGWLLDIEFITPEEYKAFKAKEVSYGNIYYKRLAL